MPKPEARNPEPVEYTRSNLPGLTQPLDYGPKTERNGDGSIKTVGLYPTALSIRHMDEGHTSMPMTTLREFTMLRIMNLITDKPGWDTKAGHTCNRCPFNYELTQRTRKITNDRIALRWKAEALNSGLDITPSMMDWIIDELRDSVSAFWETQMVRVFNGDVVKSDSMVSEEVKEALIRAVGVLEREQQGKAKDFHPGSDDKVVDIVHPSLFPLVYGLSRVLPNGETLGLRDCLSRIGNGKAIPIPDMPEAQDRFVKSYVRDRWGFRTNFKSYSTRFQWLPCDVKLAGGWGGKGSCNITSYINNLHPKRHEAVYSAIEDIIACVIPLWNATLMPLDPRYRDPKPRRRIDYWSHEYPPYPEDLRPKQLPGESYYLFSKRDRAWEAEHRTRNAVQPEPCLFDRTPCDQRPRRLITPPLDIRHTFAETGLQIIVKLANIELTPNKPHYDGGTWHVEGQMNEHICATALYYYSNSNITPSRLSFRQQSASDLHVSYRNDEHEWLEAVFGCKQRESRVQEVGDVLCKEGRLLTFPNTLQHRVQPFELADPTRPGHRKILALFLVDPNIRVISTANVPPQRRDWWTEEMYARQALGQTLPVEVQEQIFDNVEGFPIGMDEAKKLRLELVKERSAHVEEQTEMFEAQAWSLCEH